MSPPSTWVMTALIRPRTEVATPATEPAPRPCSPMPAALLRSTFRATARARSNRRSSKASTPPHRCRRGGAAAYTHGLTTGEISARFADIYGARVSKDTISRSTDKVVEEMTAWHTRPLERVYAAVSIHALHVKIRDGQVGPRSVCAAIGVDLAGHRDLLGMWAGERDGGSAKYWLAVLAELKNRGRHCCRRGTGCIRHRVGAPLPGSNSVVAQRLERFHPVPGPYDVEIRRVICSTNAIESLNARYRRHPGARAFLPNRPR